MADVVVELQEALRGELKEPVGPILTDTTELLARAGNPLVTVGDVVTYHVVTASRTPDVALVDDRTERSAVDTEISDGISAFEGFDRQVTVSNPPAVLTAELLDTLAEALDPTNGRSTLIEVDGEEDLAALPAILAAPDGASVVYGQPGEGMVHVVVDDTLRTEIADLVSRMAGEPTRLFSILDIDGV